MDAGSIAALLTAIAALGMMIYTWRRLRPENRLSDADAAERYQAMLNKSAQREQELMNRVSSLENRVDELEKKLEESEQKAAAFEDWATRLVHQLKSLDVIPVQIREPKSKPHSTVP